jgi:hypothetical protein
MSRKKRMSHLFGHVCDVSHDITPLLMSFLPSEGPDVRGAVSVDHMGVVV